jgi:tetratricopeptide (TPR) repeat protein
MIVEGSVFKSDDQVRIQIQLIGSRPERLLLTHTYERELTGILKMQRDITLDIAEKVNLAAQLSYPLPDIQSVDPRAYDNYLKGRFFADQFTSESLDNAVSSFNRAIKLNPGDALAYAGLAITYIWIGSGHGSMPANDAFALAKEAANKASELDPTLDENHYVIGWLSLLEWDWAVAEREFRRAIDLNQNSAQAHRDFAKYLVAVQRYDEAIREIEIASQLDPFSSITWADFAVTLFAAKEYEQGIVKAKKALELDSDFAPALWILGKLYRQSGDADSAIDAHERASAITPFFVYDLAVTYAATGFTEKAREILANGDSAAQPGIAIHMAQAFAELGDHDRAFENLEIAYRARIPWLFWIRHEPVFDSLHSDPRYDDLVQRLNFPE